MASGVLAGLAVILLAAAPASAGYAAGSPTPFTSQLISYHGTSYCGRGQAKIGDYANPADGQSWTRAAYWYVNCNNSTTLTVGTGWLGAVAFIYRNDAFCGATSLYYNNSPTSLFGVGGTGGCPNPSGTQYFQTWAAHYLWNDQSGVYETGGEYSPVQGY